MERDKLLENIRIKSLTTKQNNNKKKIFINSSSTKYVGVLLQENLKPLLRENNGKIYIT
jgi:hypothetical protein